MSITYLNLHLIIIFEICFTQFPATISTMQVLSKCSSVPVTCLEYVHPWTPSCSVASAEFLVVALQDSFRIYMAVYLVRKFICDEF